MHLQSCRSNFCAPQAKKKVANEETRHPCAIQGVLKRKRGVFTHIPRNTWWCGRVYLYRALYRCTIYEIFSSSLFLLYLLSAWVCILQKFCKKCSYLLEFFSFVLVCFQLTPTILKKGARHALQLVAFTSETAIKLNIQASKMSTLTF